MSSGKGDAEKARYWQRMIREAVRSGMSIREFCRQRRLKESQFYWWQHKLKAGRQDRRHGSRASIGNRRALPWSVTNRGRPTPASSWCSVTGGGCVSARVWMRRPCGRSWQPWSPRDAEFSSRDQGLPVHRPLRHAALV